MPQHACIANIDIQCIDALNTTHCFGMCCSVVGAWVNLDDAKLHRHVLEVPSPLAHMSGYIQQAWVMLWADKFAEQVGSNPDYIMFWDTDSAMGLPATCKALFDQNGRVYVAGWPIAPQKQFKATCEALLGVPCETSYM